MFFFDNPSYLFTDTALWVTAPPSIYGIPSTVRVPVVVSICMSLECCKKQIIHAPGFTAHAFFFNNNQVFFPLGGVDYMNSTSSLVSCNMSYANLFSDCETRCSEHFPAMNSLNRDGASEDKQIKWDKSTGVGSAYA